MFTHCRHCHRPLKRPEYRARGSGETCGGRITKARRPAGPETDDGHHRPVPVVPGQAALFDLDPVEVTL